ncbi:MAG: hypothetical protein QG559_1658, partial [Campylobacterota bacterium]|nr:hypothetical protein [Campylobacterota bacterium]
MFINETIGMNKPISIYFGSENRIARLFLKMNTHIEIVSARVTSRIKENKLNQ